MKIPSQWAERAAELRNRIGGLTLQETMAERKLIKVRGEKAEALAALVALNETADLAADVMKVISEPGCPEPTV